MTPPPTSIDGTEITGATIDGTEVTEITVDGDTVFTAGLPNSGLIQDYYDPRNLTKSTGDDVSSWPSTEGATNTLSTGTSASYIENDINNNPVINFDTEDALTTGYSSTLSEPVVWGFVFKDLTGSDPNNNITLADAGTALGANLDNEGGFDYRLIDSSNNRIRGGSPDKNYHICTIRWANTTVMRIDGSEIISGSLPDTLLDGLTLGNRGAGQNNGAPVNYGPFGVWDDDGTINLGDIESYLEDEYGPIL